jgi:hypothetical protein
MKSYVFSDITFVVRLKSTDVSRNISPSSSGSESKARHKPARSRKQKVLYLINWNCLTSLICVVTFSKCILQLRTKLNFSDNTNMIRRIATECIIFEMFSCDFPYLFLFSEKQITLQCKRIENIFL